MTHEFNCLFLFGEPAYVNYALLCLRKNKSQKYFSAQTQTLWQNANMRSPHHHHHHHKSTPLSPAHWRKLNICLFSPSLLQNLASFSNFSFFFFFFFSWSGLGFPRYRQIQFTALFFFEGAQFFSAFLYMKPGGWQHWDWEPGPNRYRTSFDRL